MELNTYKSESSVYPQVVQIEKVRKNINTGQKVGDPSYEDVTLATSNDYLNLVSKISEENRDSLRISEELGFEDYIERRLVKL